ncbi:hypothetical protein ACHAXS_002869 [Conticribra weissflogii]
MKTTCGSGDDISAHGYCNETMQFVCKKSTTLSSAPSPIEGLSIGDIRKVVNMRRCIQAKIRMSKLKRIKPKDAPKRPLSGYNFFFKDERVRILEAGIIGTMGFQTMAKTVGSRWKALSEDQRKPYQERAKADMVRYRGEMEDYNAKKTAGVAGMTRAEIIQIVEKRKKKRSSINRQKITTMKSSTMSTQRKISSTSSRAA